MSGTLYVIGTGPGSPEQTTLEAQAAIAASSHFFGYKPYTERLNLPSTVFPTVSGEKKIIVRRSQTLRVEMLQCASIPKGSVGLIKLLTRMRRTQPSLVPLGTPTVGTQVNPVT